MVYVVIIAVLIAAGVLVMMQDEIRNGYFRWRDYLQTTPLLYGAGWLIVQFESILPTGEGLSFYLLLAMRTVLAFGLLVVVWGGTLTAGALLIRFLLPGPKAT